MGDSVPDGGTPRRRKPTSPGSAVLTPPTGLPAIHDLADPDLADRDLNGLVPAQRGPDDRRPSAPPPTVVEPCTCGHARAAHDHYRPGHDCGACGAEECSDFRPVGGVMRRGMRKMGLAD